MEPVTHTLTGLVLGRAGANRLAPYATPALLVAANVSDIDVLHILGGATSYLEHHRTWSHSLLGGTLLGAGVALVFWSLARRRPGSRAGELGRLLVVCLLGAYSHLVLDWSTPYGTQLLWPVKQRWYALDWFPFINLWMPAILLLGLALPALFALISEEIGARRSQRGARWGAWMALVVCAALAATHAWFHAEGEALLESRLYGDRTPVRVAAFPTALNPFRWRGVVETATTYETMELTLLGGPRGRRDFSTFYKPAGRPALEAALATRTARVFLSWARFPHATITPWGEGWRIRLRDLRYGADAPPTRRFVAWIDLSPKLDVLGEELRWGRSAEEPPR